MEADYKNDEKQQDCVENKVEEEKKILLDEIDQLKKLLELAKKKDEQDQLKYIYICFNFITNNNSKF